MNKQPLISSELIAMLETFVNKELYAQYFYRSLANAMQQIGYFGAQKYFLAESASEGEHYQKHIDFLNDVNVSPRLAPIPSGPTPKSINEAFQMAFDTEYGLCKDYKAATSAALTKDIEVFGHLQGFVEIQRQSVGEYGDLLARLSLCGTNEAALLEFDEHLNG